ncbi:MAG: TetR/AcrR family transcriptional regulator [Clostridiales bacterium]|nr:TetR/AcrR family transcriptional regulator [Clostridiales bacterium]
MKNIDNDFKEKILSTTLELIDQNGGALNVTLRQVAREVNCSAPNIYNYFASFDDLLNSVLIKICDNFTQSMQEQLLLAKSSEDILVTAFTSFISYILDNPSRVNFFYFERLSFDVHESTQGVAEGVGHGMATLLVEGSDGAITMNKAQDASSILHWYIIGQLSEYVTGRIDITNKAEYIDTLVATCKNLLIKYTSEVGK